MRRAVPAPLRARAVPQPFPAPVRGWIENENLAANGGGGMLVAENVFPLASTVRVRGGSLRVATVGDDPILSLIPFRSGTTTKLFAATASAVYDISALNPTTVPVPLLTLQDSGYWSATQFGTAGGEYLVMVNGANSARYWNGSSFQLLTDTSTPISLTGIATGNLLRVWQHAERVWAIQKNSLKAWYLPVNAIGGAMEQFSLSGVFKRGGNLYIGASWSQDTGSGPDDYCVFITDQGEVAVYSGIDPSSVDTWAKVGVYDLGTPISPDTINAGGDLLVCTVDGIVPLSACMNKDPAALSVAAITRPIEQAWARAVSTRDVTKPIRLMKWQGEKMIVVGLPHRNEVFVCNAQTGAWARWTGINAQALVAYGAGAYFSDAVGEVFQFEAAGSDDGRIYVARMSWLPDHLRAAGAYKTANQCRATFRALAPFRPALSVATDYAKRFPVAPDVEPDASSPALWDVGQWDVSKWDDSPDSEERETITTQWVSVDASGINHAPQVQISCGSARRPDAELIAFDIMFEAGETVV